MHHDDDARTSSFDECCLKYHISKTQHDLMPTHSIDRSVQRTDEVMSEWWRPEDHEIHSERRLSRWQKKICCACETIWTETSVSCWWTDKKQCFWSMDHGVKTMTHWKRCQCSHCSCTRGIAWHKRFFVHVHANDDKAWLGQVGIGNPDSEQIGENNLHDCWLCEGNDVCQHAQMMWMVWRMYRASRPHKRNHGCDPGGFWQCNLLQGGADRVDHWRFRQHLRQRHRQEAFSKSNTRCKWWTKFLSSSVWQDACATPIGTKFLTSTSATDTWFKSGHDWCRRSSRFFNLKQEYFVTTCAVQQPRSKQASIVVSRMMTKNRKFKMYKFTIKKSSGAHLRSDSCCYWESGLAFVDSCWTACKEPLTRRRTWWQSWWTRCRTSNSRSKKFNLCLCKHKGKERHHVVSWWRRFRDSCRGRRFGVVRFQWGLIRTNLIWMKSLCSIASWGTSRRWTGSYSLTVVHDPRHVDIVTDMLSSSSVKKSLNEVSQWKRLGVRGAIAWWACEAICWREARPVAVRAISRWVNSTPAARRWKSGADDICWEDRIWSGGSWCIDYQKWARSFHG